MCNIYVYIIDTHAYKYIPICKHTYMWSYFQRQDENTQIHIHARVHTHTHMNVYTHAYAHMYACT